MSKVYFNPVILEKAKQLFYAVYNDGDRVRIYRTDWEYSEEEVFHNAIIAMTTGKLLTV